MTMQRLMVATLSGESANVVESLFRLWRNAGSAPEAVDCFCAALREHGASLPIIYFGEWVDRWLMGDLVPGPDMVEGSRFQATCLSPEQAVAWADRCGHQFAEQGWLAARLREAATGWGSMADRLAVVVTREVLASTPTDDEIRASFDVVPEWLRQTQTMSGGS